MASTRRLLTACCVCLCAAALTASAQDGSDTAQIVQLLRARQYDDALQATQHLLASRPHDCRLLSLSGLALNGMGRAAEAGHAFRQALQFCPNDLLALEGAAQIAYARREPDAPQLLLRILRLRPDDVTTHAMLAAAYRGKQECKAALPHFEASRALFDSHPQLQEGYAFCLASTGNYDKAAANYEQLLNTDPDETARYNLAIVQWKLHDAKAALATLQPLLKQNDSESVLQLGARLAEETGDTSQAVRLLRAAILRDPKDIDNYLDFAQLSFNHRSYQVGMDMVNAGLTQLPDSARLYLARGVLEVQVAHFDAAMADFNRAHQLDPQLSLAMDALGIVQSQRYNSAAALKLFREQARVHPHDGLLQYLYAEAASESDAGDETLREAIAAAERSIAIDGQYEPARVLLARLYLQANQAQQALTQAEVALRIRPNDDTALYQEIMARRRLGQTADIQKLVRQMNTIRQQNAQQAKEKPQYVLRDEVPHESTP